MDNGQLSLNKKEILFIILSFIISLCVYSLDVVEIANREFLTIEETIELAEKEPTENRKLISDLKKLEKMSGQEEKKTEDIFKFIDQLPYMPCTEALRFLILSPEEQLNSANYIYSVFTGCPKTNPLKDQVYLKILEASISENNFSWSYNAARDLSDQAKETPAYKTFMTTHSQN